MLPHRAPSPRHLRTVGMVNRTVPGAFTASEKFDVGVDLGSPVSLDYATKAPFPFGGTIRQVPFGGTIRQVKVELR